MSREGKKDLQLQSEREDGRCVDEGAQGDVVECEVMDDATLNSLH